MKFIGKHKRKNGQENEIGYQIRKHKKRTHFVIDKWLWTPHDATEYKHFGVHKIHVFQNRTQNNLLNSHCIFVSFR